MFRLPFELAWNELSVHHERSQRMSGINLKCESGRESDLDSSSGSRRSRTSLVLIGICLCAILLPMGCKKDKKAEEAKKPPKKEVEQNRDLTPEEKKISDLIKSEDLTLDLTPQLNSIAGWLEQKDRSELPEQLAKLETVYGLVDADPAHVLHESDKVPEYLEVGYWPVAEKPSAGPSNPLAALNVLNVEWETVKFGVVSCGFSNEDQTELTIETKLEGRGADPDGKMHGLKGLQNIVFSKPGSTWNLTQWKQTKLQIKRSPAPMFRDVLGEVVKDEKTVENATRSFIDEIIVRSAEKGAQSLLVPVHEKWANLSSNQSFSTVSVVDFNNDGHDDLFLTAKWGPTQMLKNNGDGTFVDVAEEIGLKEPYLVNCALFVDLDNDGDKDCLLGRSMEPVKILENNDGKFKNVTKKNSDLGKQYFITAMCATDVNSDGLLDVYLCNYPPLNTPFHDVFVNEFERNKFLDKLEGQDQFLNLASTSNVLLMNRGGGRLERAEYDETISQWRRTFQTVAADFDDDGDEDLYICNDFAPDAMLRNDTPKGAKDPVFVDVTQEMLKGAPLGFGMGASWGDYDQDGDLDLYVTNMYSKAGNRIIKVMGEVDPRIAVAAYGNFLWENQGGTFEQRSGSEDGQMHVNMVGWSWGGQFADFDNNGMLDVYVPSGYYTAPQEVETEVDT